MIEINWIMLNVMYDARLNVKCHSKPNDDVYRKNNYRFTLILMIQTAIRYAFS